MKFRLTLFSILLLVLAVAFYTYLYFFYIPEHSTIDKHFHRIPEELYIYQNGKEFFFRDKKLIDRFSSLVQKKKGEKLSTAEAIAIIKDSIIHFDYGYKEDGMWITGDGRIIFAVDKAEIRNRTIIGYLWWKIASDRSIYLYYITDPDPKVIGIAHDILKKIKH